MFHPDLLAGTPLQSLMGRYSYFSYDTNEALFPTKEEKDILLNLFGMIASELRRDDEHRIPIVVDYIKLILDYCNRFYDRQFHSRHIENKDILARFELLMDEYYRSGMAAREGLLTVQYCADKLCVSANYFSDMIRKDTGMSALKHIHKKTLEMSKEMLSGTEESISRISAAMGFQYSQHFSKWFKDMEGCTPNAYRSLVRHKADDRL